jgi:DNA-binding transcriptional LysR family regulator
MEFLGGVQRRFERENAQLMLAMQYRPDDLLVAEALPMRELVLVTASDHPMAKTSHTPQSLQGELELAVHDSSELTSGRDTNSTRGGRVFYLSDFHTKRQGLLMGLGYGWIPTPLVAEDLARGALVELTTSTGSRQSITPYLVQRVDRPLGLAGQRLLQGIRDHWPAPGS